MWSSQGGAATDGMYFSWHQDAAARHHLVGPPRRRPQGARSGDDHMNLKWLDSTATGVFAAIKTSFTSATQPLIQLLVLDVTANVVPAHDRDRRGVPQPGDPADRRDRTGAVA